MKKKETPLADDARKQPGPFDVATIEALVALMSKHEISEIDLREGEQRIGLRRGGYTPTASAPLSFAEMPTAAPTSPPPRAAEPSLAPSTRQLLEIKSPTVGTFYAQEKPGSPPYVTPGTRVTPTTTVCQIEAMKIFNEIQAECSGVLVEVCVQNKAFVEFGTVLFRVDPNG